MTDKTTSINFEHSLEALDKLVNNMEKGTLSLEDSLKAFEQGVKLIKSCQDAIMTAKQKIAVLSCTDQKTLENFSLDKDDHSA